MCSQGLVCVMFTGIVGIHAFYAGRIRQGLLFLGLPVLGILCMFLAPINLTFAFIMPYLSLLFAAVFALGDLIRILVGAYKDGNGRKITRWT